jgi:hypothetical protein
VYAAQGITHKLKWNQTIRGAPGGPASAGSAADTPLGVLVDATRGGRDVHASTGDLDAGGNGNTRGNSTPPVLTSGLADVRCC